MPQEDEGYRVQEDPGESMMPAALYALAPVSSPRWMRDLVLRSSLSRFFDIQGARYI